MRWLVAGGVVDPGRSGVGGKDPGNLGASECGPTSVGNSKSGVDCVKLGIFR